MNILSRLLGNATQVEASDVESQLSEILVPGEKVVSAFKLVRDMMVFTEHRLIAVNVQGITGSKVCYDSILYKAVSRFSIETAGTLDLDSEITIWVSGVSTPVKFNFKRGTDLAAVQRLLAHCVFGAKLSA